MNYAIDDMELEEQFRASLQRHAEDADTSVDLLGPAQASARGRRRRTWAAGAVGLAAAALVTAVVVQNVGGPGGPGKPQFAGDEEVTDQWRSESWHGVELDVPADWAWGSGPVESGNETLRCGGPDEALPYVGRAVMASDVCAMVDEPVRGTYVWLGATMPAGTRDLGGGYVSRTVDFHGTRITVTTDNEALSDHIIESLRAPEGCAPSLDAAPTVDSMLTEGMGDVTGARICAYSRFESDDGTYWLVYNATLDARQAMRYHDALYDGTRQNDREFCDQRDEMVLVRMEGTDFYGDVPVTQDSVVAPLCQQWSGGPGSVTPMSDEAERTWAVGGLPVTLYALIGPMG